ncbi:MAG: GntR family transcriptional regulator [Bacillota bacterium]
MRSSLFIQTRQNLLKLIKEREVVTRENQLLSEEELAHKLQVSRTTIREVLASLTNEGLISKKHGLGNFVHYSALNTKMRIDQTREFLDLIEEAGYRVKSIINPESFGLHASVEMARKLGLNPEDELFFFQCTYQADEQPAIHCHLYISRAKLKVVPSIEMEKDIFTFLKKYADEEITHTIVWLKSKNCLPPLSDIFGIDNGTSIMFWEEMYYNLFDEIVCYAEIYFNPNVIDMSMLRKNGIY